MRMSSLISLYIFTLSNDLLVSNAVVSMRAGIMVETCIVYVVYVVSVK